MPGAQIPDWLANRPTALERIDLPKLPGFSQESLLTAWPVFVASCRRILREAPATGAPYPELLGAAGRAIAVSPRDEDEARRWFVDNFTAYRLAPNAAAGEARPFMTGYFEPELAASRTPAPGFVEPARSRPADLIDVALEYRGGQFTGARQTSDGGLSPYWTRAEIDEGYSPAPPLAWLRDPVDLFIAQVQGSARVRFQDGVRARLAYAGKNGRPYTSLGKILIQKGYLKASEMSLETLSATLRALVADPGIGRSILHHNESYVFFRLEPEIDEGLGPVGAEGVPLTPLRSLAVDRRHWPFGLPFWVSGRFPWPHNESVFNRMMIAQDTGSAIVGVGRGDIFCGSGDEAGRRAGLLQHGVDLFVLSPRGL